MVPAETPARAAALALLPPPHPPSLVHLSAPPRKPCLPAGRVHFPLGCTPLSSGCRPLGPSFPLPAVSRRVRPLIGRSRLQGQNDAEPHCLGFSGKLLLLSRPARQAQAVTRGGEWTEERGAPGAPVTLLQMQQPGSWRQLPGHQVQSLPQQSCHSIVF